VGKQDAYRWRFHQLVLPGDPDILSAGGPSEIKRIYELATTWDKPVMPRSPQAGSNSMASLHAHATMNSPPSSPVRWTNWRSCHGEGALPVKGNMHLSDRPGPGIEVNETAGASLTV